MSLEVFKIIGSLGMNLVSSNHEAEKPTKDDLPEVRQAYVEGQLGNTPSRKARRYIAVMITNVWVFCMVVMVICSALERKIPEQLWELLEQASFAFVAVLAFYFGRNIVNKSTLDNLSNRLIGTKEKK